MALILHTGFGPNINPIKDEFTGDLFREVDPGEISGQDLLNADLMLIGPFAADPHRVVQRVTREDALVSTVVLPKADDYARVKQSLLFAPFVGKSSSCLRFDAGVYPQLKKAALQTRQRRKFAQVEASLKQEGSAMIPSVEIEQLGNFLNQAPIGTILLNKDLHIVALNTFARRLFNLQAFETPTELVAIWDEEASTMIAGHLKSDRSIKMLEIQSKGQYYEVSFADVLSEKSEKLDILLISNITDRKFEDQRIRSVLDALPQMAWTTNANGEVTYLTAGWYKFTGQSYSQAMGEGWKSVIHPDDRAQLTGTWEAAVKARHPFEEEARYRRADGMYRWHLVRGIPIYSGTEKLSYWLGTCTDIDDHKVHEEELAAKVKESTAALLKANELLKKSNTDLEEFAYIASHDLKEPLRKMQTFIRRARDIKEGHSAEIYLEKVESAAQRMARLIEDILGYSHLSKGTEFGKVDLNEVVRNIMSELELSIKEKGAQVIPGELPQVEGNAVQLSQLFTNLISNSLKYSKKKPKIQLSGRIVSPESGQDAYAEIILKDNGIGFDQKYAEQIFSVFKRLHTKEEYSGSGIGLAMVKKIVNNHHGAIRAEASPGEGASFILQLPLRQG